MLTPAAPLNHHLRFVCLNGGYDLPAMIEALPQRIIYLKALSQPNVWTRDLPELTEDQWTVHGLLDLFREADGELALYESRLTRLLIFGTSNDNHFHHHDPFDHLVEAVDHIMTYS
jgi:hypothetical protein